MGSFLAAWRAAPRADRFASIVGSVVFLAIEVPAILLIAKGGHLATALALFAAAHLWAFAFARWTSARRRERPARAAESS